MISAVQRQQGKLVAGLQVAERNRLRCVQMPVYKSSDHAASMLL
jgi:hypothetical protein